MNYSSQNRMIVLFHSYRALIITIAAFMCLIGGASLTNAATAPVLVLTVNGGGVAAVVNDEPVELGWYLDGSVTNCSLIQDNSVTGVSTITTIDTSSLPTSGVTMVTPPPNSTTNFILNCDGAVDEVPVNVEPPIVTMSVDQGTDLVNNALTGYVSAVTVRWSSVNATRCSLVSRESATVPLKLESSYLWDDYWDEYGVSGRIHYDGSPRYINETTTFYVTCYNDNTGAEDTASITVNVNNPPPPNPPVVNLWSPNYPNVSRSLLYGYAWVDVGFNSSNATWCTERAYYENGVQYANPPNWGAGSWVLSRNFTGIQLSTTTIFEITCGRNEVTLGGVTYPATSTTERLQINVLMPGGVVGDVTTWDRSTLPPVGATISASPNPTTKVALTGYAGTNATVFRQNASYCFLKAYRMNAVTGLYTDEFNLSNWTRTLNNNGTSTFAVSLSTTTKLVADCWRDYDRNNPAATPAELDSGHEVVETIVVVIHPDEPAPPPVLYMYGNAVRKSANDLWTNHTEMLGFNNLAGNPQYIENTSALNSSSRISFDFVHPYGADDDYAIHLRMCDENDGESTFRVYVKDVLVGQYTTNSAASPDSLCNGSTATYKRVAQNIAITDGDKITIECDTPADGERCRLLDVLFGAEGNLVTPQVNPVVTSVEQTILVLADNATYCGGSGELGHWAYPISAPRYSWWGNKTYTYFDSSDHTASMVRTPLATSTRFTVTCWRTGDALTDQEEVNVYVPFSTTLSAQTTVGSGQCIDDGSFGSFGVQMDAPPGYGPDGDGFCSPMVDLASISPALSIAGAVEDNVNGTYDDLDALIVIQNLGPGGLPANSSVAYKAVMTLMPVFGLPDMETPAGDFDGELVAPDVDSITQSSTLTRTFNGVPFGTHTVCARVNLDGSPNYPEVSDDLANNSSCTTITLPVPRPPMSISTERKLVRNQESATIDWSVNVTYQLLCTVRGPGGLNQSFDTSLVGPDHTDTFTTSPLSSTGEYQLQCTEPITNTVFTETLRVEMVPDVQER